MSVEFDIAVLRAPHDPKDYIDMVQLIERAKCAADEIERLTEENETLRYELKGDDL